MPNINLGNVVGLLRSQTPPTKTYVLWAKILNPSFPDLVELHYWDNLASVWVPLLDPTHQYWLRPVIDNVTTAPPVGPAEMDRYIIPASPTGAWAGKEGQVATWKGGAWQYTIPLDGYIVNVRTDPNALYDYRGIYGAGGFWALNDFSVPVTAGNYIPLVQKAAPLGVPGLDSSAKLVSSYLYPDTIAYNPADSGAWPVGTNTIKKALDHIITVAGGGGGGGGGIPGLTDVLGVSGNGGGQAITNVTIDAGLITSGTLNIARLPQAALERMYVYGGVATLPQSAGLTTGNVQNGDTVKMTSTGLVYAVIDDTQLNQAAGYEIYAVGSAASVPWAGVTGTPSVAGSGGYGIQSAALTVLGNPTNGLAFVSSIAAGAPGDVLRRSGTTLGFGTIPHTSITVANTARLMGRFTAAGGVMEEISLGSGLSLNTSTGTLSATGTLTGTGVAGAVATWSSATNLTNHIGFTYDATNTILKAPRLQTTFAGTPTLGILDGEIYYSTTLFDYRARINGFWANITRADEFVEPGTTFTLTELHRNSIVRFTSNSAVTVTLPPGLSARYSTTLVKSGTGDVNVVTAGTYVGTSNQILLQNTAAMFYHSGGNIWRGYGSLGVTGTGGGGGSGSVTTVSSGNMVNFFTTNVANASTTPAITYTAVSTTANMFWAGPENGAATSPAYRLITLSDLPNINETTAGGSTYTIQPSDNKKVIRCSAACNIVVPDGAAFPIGFSCTVYRNAGAVTFSPVNGGVILEGTGTSIPVQYGYASVWLRATNVWALGGLLTTSGGGSGTTYTFNQGLTESGGVASIGGPVSGLRFILYPSVNDTGEVVLGTANAGLGPRLNRLTFYGGTVTLETGSDIRLYVSTSGISIRPSAASTLGDLWYNGPTGLLVRIPIGAAGQTLTVSGGVPTWVTPSGSGVTQTFTNGITSLSSNVFGLGGVITQTTAIALGTQQFGIVSTSGAQTTQFSIQGSGDRTILNLVSLSATEYYRTYIGLSGMFMEYNNNGNEKQILFDKTIAGIAVSDSYSNKGFVYTEDNSANYTTLSIPHVGYINTKIAGRNISPTFGALGAPQNGYMMVWDNTNTRFNLVAPPSGSGGTGTVTSVSTSTTTFITGTVTLANTTPNIALSYNGTLPTARGGTGLTTIGTAGQAIRVNGAGNALEYYSPTGFALSDGDKGNITVSGSGTVWNIDNDVVTFAKMQNSVAGQSVIGKTGAGAGDFAEITGATNGYVLRVASLTLGFGTIGTASIDNAAITYAKIQNVSATSRIIGRITAGAGPFEELTAAQATSILNPFTTSLKGLVPASGGGTTNFLRADGSWAAPAGGGGGITNASSVNEMPRTVVANSNIGATGIFYGGTLGDIQLGGLSTLTPGVTRTVHINGSSTNIGLTLTTKGSGSLSLVPGTGGVVVVGNPTDSRQIQMGTNGTDNYITTFNGNVALGVQGSYGVYLRGNTNITATAPSVIFGNNGLTGSMTMTFTGQNRITGSAGQIMTLSTTHFIEMIGSLGVNILAGGGAAVNIGGVSGNNITLAVLNATSTYLEITGLTTAVPGLSNKVYKDASGYLRIT